jgi:chemotaxis protein methyltransferase CheR
MNATAVDLSPHQFHEVRELVHRVSGIHLHTGKLELVRARLAPRLRELGMFDFRSYLDRVATDATDSELGRLVDLLTTNQTSFFREPRHFQILRERVVPELYRAGRPLRIWSAGCSSGQEPYSLAMALLHQLGAHAHARILATDISARALAQARTGVYGEEAVRQVPPPLRRWLDRVGTRSPRRYRAGETLRAKVSFARHNLIGPWPMTGQFGLVCCRNVMIYFDRATQQRLVERFWSVLAPGGYLFIGHSESLAAHDHGLEYVQPAVYRRPA